MEGIARYTAEWSHSVAVDHRVVVPSLSDLVHDLHLVSRMDRFEERYDDPWLRYYQRHNPQCVRRADIALMAFALLQMCASGTTIAYSTDAINDKFYVFVASVVSIALQMLGLYVALTRCESRTDQLTAVSEHTRAATRSHDVSQNLRP